MQPDADVTKFEDDQMAESMDFLAVDANLDKQVEHSAHYPTVANVEGAPLTGWTIDKPWRPKW